MVDLKPILRIRPAQVEDDRYKWDSPRNQVCHLCTYLVTNHAHYYLA